MTAKKRPEAKELVDFTLRGVDRQSWAEAKKQATLQGITITEYVIRSIRAANRDALQKAA